jgi:hypothetical protein
VVCTFFFGKVHSLSVAPEPLAVWNKELEGLVFNSLSKILEASAEDMYLAAPKSVSEYL